MMFALKLALLCVLFGFAQCGQRIDIILSGRNLPKTDTISEIDPFIKVYYKFDSNSNYISYGQTGYSKDNPNPNWPEVFTFDYVVGSAQIAKFELWDEDVQFNNHVEDVVLPLGTLVAGADNAGMYEHKLAGSNGRVLFKVRIDGVIG